ncbi:DNA ligase 4-like [Rhopilema esculentum]|uniref:DNA ligase 4-like n=1 Tax=Rhopilema esculentum TaxID=499914 RepID=UPI0031D0D36E
MAEEDRGGQVACQVPFFDLCMVIQKIDDSQGKEKKKDIFKKFLHRWREVHIRIHRDINNNKNDTFFPAMRLFLPSLDKERPSYGMKEVVLAKYYIDVLNIAKESDDAKKLLNYRAPSSARHIAGDFASVAYLVLKDRCPQHGSLTVSDVNACLDAMALANVEKKRDVLKAQICKLIRNTSAIEQKWLIRMILKELKIGLSENSIFSVFHPDAAELFNVCSSLSKVCSDLRDPNSTLSEVEIELFSPFRPMLGQRSSFQEVEKIMNYKPFLIETKVDGERIQLHKKGDEYRYFSRGCHDYTESFGKTVFRGTLTPHLSFAFPSNIKTLILDGEMTAYDPNSGLFIPKGGNIDVKAEVLDGVHPCFVVFDILLLNDEKLTNLPLQQRVEKLKGIIKPVPGRLQIIERKTASKKEEVINALNDAIDKREEGIVIKDPESIYKPSKRKGSGWLKIKPDYIDSLSDQLDVLIVGGYYGVGRRGGMVSHFLCAIAVPPQQPNEYPSVFHSFCKVGSGYSLKELKELCDALEPHWKTFDPKMPPSSIIFAPGLKEKPDVWIEPSKSKIVQLKAAEITESEKYKCKCTLRFPRVDTIRDDKHWYDCMDLDELSRLREISGGYLTNKQVTDDGTEEPVKKKKRTVTKLEQPRRIAGHFKGADVSSIKEVSNLFEDHEFCVMNGSSEHSKHDLEKRIAEHGGKFVQNAGKDTNCVIAEKVNVRVKNIISLGRHDVVSVSWLVACLNKGKVLAYKPNEMIFTSEKTKKIFSLEYDEFGDSYTKEIDAKNLQEIFRNMESKDRVRSTAEEVAEIEFRYFPNDSPYGIFRGCRSFFDKWADPDCPNEVRIFFVCSFVSPLFCLSAQFFACQPTFLLVRTLFCLSAQFFACQPTFLLVSPLFCLSAHFFACQPNFLLVSPIFCLSAHFFACPHTFLIVCLLACSSARPTACILVSNTACTIIKTAIVFKSLLTGYFSALDLRFHGGDVMNQFSPGTTHVIVRKSDLSRLPVFRQRIRNMTKKPHIVTEDWIQSCIEKFQKIDEKHFEPL